MKNVNVSVLVSMDTLADTLCSGMEGGINYWAKIVNYIEPSDLNLKAYFSNSWTGRVYKHIHYPLLPGGVVLIKDVEDEDSKTYRLDFPAIERGLELMANNWSWHFGDMIGEKGDATTGDVLIQCALFGTIVYG